MKTTMRVWAIALIAVLLIGTLSGCAETLNGSYRADTLGTGAVYTFSGKNVRVDVLMLGAVVTSFEGTYALEDGKITFTFGDTDSDESQKYSGTFDFAETETGIKIGLIEYTKEM